MASLKCWMLTTLLASGAVHAAVLPPLPVARDDSFLLISLVLNVSAPGLLANDVGGIGPLIVSSFFDPAQGVLETVVTNGSFRYRAPTGFTGVDTFRYAALDELGRFSMATVSIQVMAVPEPSQALLLLAGLALLAGRARRR